MQLFPAKLNLKFSDGNAIFKGADWSIEVTIIERTKSIETPVDLTGYLGICQIREKPDSEQAVAAPLITFTDPTNGTFTISLDKSETAVIPASGKSPVDVTVYQYEVLLKDPDAVVSRALYGTVDVSPSLVKEK